MKHCIKKQKVVCSCYILLIHMHITMLVVSILEWLAHKMIRFACFERAGLVFLCFLQEHIF